MRFEGSKVVSSLSPFGIESRIFRKFSTFSSFFVLYRYGESFRVILWVRESFRSRKTFKAGISLERSVFFEFRLRFLQLFQRSMGCLRCEEGIRSSSLSETRQKDPSFWRSSWDSFSFFSTSSTSNDGFKVCWGFQRLFKVWIPLERA